MSELIAIHITEIIYIHQFFTGIITPRWELHKFNEYSVFYKYKLDGNIQGILRDKLTIFLDSPKNIAILTRMENLSRTEAIHLSMALTLSLVQHIYGMEQKYLKFKETLITDDYFGFINTRNFALCITEEGKLDYNSRDKDIIKKLETNLCNSIMEKVNSYDVDKQFEIIFLDMLDKISEENQRL